MSFVIGAVAKSFRYVALSIERIQAGIIVLATILGIFPVLVFSVIPEALMGRTLIPYEFSFLSLLSFPFGYQYAILRLKLVNLDSTVNRGAAFTFVILILAGLYALVFSLLSRYFSGVFDQYPLVGMVITIVIAFASRKLYSRLFSWVNHVLYGEWYDYRSAINLINHHLKSVESEDRAIATTFCQVVMKSLQLDFVAVILQDRFFTFVEPGSEPVSQRISDENFEAVWKQISESKETSEKPNDILLDPILPKRLMPKTHLITPFRSQEQIYGLLILGRKRGDGIFEKSDLEVLDVAIHQAQISMEKAGLLNDVRQYSYEIRELHRKVTDTREQERKQVSRELHDEVIQSLVGLNYRLSNMRRHKHQLKEDDFLAVQEGLVSVLEEVRQICTNLRPPVLDSLDLVSAYRAKIDEVQRKSEFQIRFFVHGDKEQYIPEDVRGFAYRLLGESLANIRKHANATSVEVHLSINSTEITIIVEDDGQGFSVPNKLSSLERTQHFGLVSLLEDVRAVKGTLEIDSTIGEGCCLVATIPLTR
jgi:signal transduction histidine kinase